jgi:hypothetical protein
MEYRYIRLIPCLLLVLLTVSPPVIDESLAYSYPFPRSPLRIMTYNVKMKPAPSNSADEFLNKSGNNIDHADRAYHIAHSILDDDIDIVVLNEAFTSDGQMAFVNALEPTYPYYIQYLDENGIDPYQDSGLMLFSKHPFVKLDKKNYPALDVIANNGSGLDDSGYPNTEWEEVAFVGFGGACMSGDCWSNKGACLVQIEHSVSSERFVVVFTHLQATYSDDSEKDQQRSKKIRRKQLGRIKEMIHGSLDPLTMLDHRLFFMGDMNIDGNRAGGDLSDYKKSFGGGIPFYSCDELLCPNPDDDDFGLMFSYRVFQDMWDHDQVHTDLGRTSHTQVATSGTKSSSLPPTRFAFNPVTRVCVTISITIPT